MFKKDKEATASRNLPLYKARIGKMKDKKSIQIISGKKELTILLENEEECEQWLNSMIFHQLEIDAIISSIVVWIEMSQIDLLQKNCLVFLFCLNTDIAHDDIASNFTECA